MEREKKKRRRAEKAENQMKSEADEPVAAEVGAAEASPPPTEEEVEEFFAILRRMRVAVKYFEKDGFNNTSKISGVKEPQSSIAAADGGGKREAVKGGLDLNTVPESESSLV